MARRALTSGELKMFQSQSEVQRICSDWSQHFAPADLIDSQANADAIMVYISQRLGGVVTTSNLNQAVQALRAEGKLQLVPPPPAKTPEQVQIDAINEQSKRWQKQHWETLNQTKERNFAAEVDAANAEKARIKEQADAERTIANIISNYTCGHARLGNVIDYAETERRQKELRTLETRVGGKRDAVKTLALVREAISKLPG
jgi:hypothetical protein